MLCGDCPLLISDTPKRAVCCSGPKGVILDEMPQSSNTKLLMPSIMPTKPPSVGDIITMPRKIGRRVVMQTYKIVGVNHEKATCDIEKTGNRKARRKQGSKKK